MRDSSACTTAFTLGHFYGRLRGVSLRQGWEDESRNWAAFARTPGHDRAHENINLPVLLDLLPPAGRRTLDLACGEGRISRVLRSRGHRVVGIDASPTMVRLAAEQESRVLVGDAARLPLADGAVDLVVAYMCLHDIDEMPRAVAEVSRVLEPSGRLCLAIPHPVSSAGAFTRREPDAPFVISGSYLDPAPRRLVVERGGIRLTFHSEHRPLEAYMRALEAGGLLTEALREVRAPDPADRQWQRIPMFLHLCAIKSP
jgi:SAM-dependent methyltransferase